VLFPHELGFRGFTLVEIGAQRHVRLRIRLCVEVVEGVGVFGLSLAQTRLRLLKFGLLREGGRLLSGLFPRGRQVQVRIFVLLNLDLELLPRCNAHPLGPLIKRVQAHLHEVVVADLPLEALHADLGLLHLLLETLDLLNAHIVLLFKFLLLNFLFEVIN